MILAKILLRMQTHFYRPKSQAIAIIVISAALGILGLVFFITRFYLIASLIGIGFGVLLAPLMNVMQVRFKVPRALSAVMMILIIVGGVAGMGYGMFALLADQVHTLIVQTPKIAASLQVRVDRVFENHPWLEQQVRNLNVAQTARSTLYTLFEGVQISLTAVAGFVLVLTLAIYTAINSQEYFRSILSLFPAYLRPKTSRVLGSSATVLRQWLKGQLIVMGISGALTTLYLWILGIDYWLLLGFLTGILGFIPYVGSFITVFITAAVTLGSDPSKIWWVIGMYLVLQQVEGNITIPIVMRERVQLPEVHMIVFMLILGGLFGILGVFIAPPLLAVLREIYNKTYGPLMDSKIIKPE